jgi:hypothetical protein
MTAVLCPAASYSYVVTFPRSSVRDLCPEPGSGLTVIRGVNLYGATSATVGGGPNNDIVQNHLDGAWSLFDTKIFGFSPNYASGTPVVVTTPGGTATFTIP